MLFLDSQGWPWLRLVCKPAAMASSSPEAAAAAVTRRHRLRKLSAPQPVIPQQRWWRRGWGRQRVGRAMHERVPRGWGAQQCREGVPVAGDTVPALHMAKEWKSTSFLSTHLAFSQLHINFPLSHQALTVWPPLTDIGSSYLI